MTTVIAAVIILGLLILFHELGHFSIAKLVGIKVHEFSIGMGPLISKFTRGETTYSLRILPIGGYVKLEGEDQESSDVKAFGNKPLWARIAVLAAGAIMNFILGFIIFVILLSRVDAIAEPVIESLMPDMPAAQAGLMQGDRIIKLNNKRIHTQKDIFFYLDKNQDKTINMVIKRDGKTMTLPVKPQMNEQYQRYMLGYTARTVKPNPINVITNSYYETLFYANYIFASLTELVTGKIGFNNVSGPVGIVGAIGGAAKAGIEPLMILAAIISINLGIFNLLPIPALDGSRIVFLLVEAIRRKPINPEKEGLVHMIGLAALLLLMLFATFNDIMRLAK